jgi:hypothetical protein
MCLNSNSECRNDCTNKEPPFFNENGLKLCATPDCTCYKFSLTGCSGELFLRNVENDYEEIKLIETTCKTCDSHIALVLSSVDRKGNHEILNKFKNKKIRITIEEVCD